MHRRTFLHTTLLASLTTMSGPLRSSNAGSKRPLPPHCALTETITAYTELFFTTGEETLDRQLVAELHAIAAVFEVSPGFGIIDDSAKPNAYATAEARVPQTRGTVCLGRTLLFMELHAHSWGGTAVAGILAHEFGHIVQFFSPLYTALQRRAGTARLVELHADFLAGYYLGAKKRLQDVAIGIFAESLYAKGDTAFHSIQHHGTPLQRVSAMNSGYTVGLEGQKTIREAMAWGAAFVQTL